MTRGFTLVEMAIVLVVMGLIMMTVFPALTGLRTSSLRSTTQSNLQALMRATAAYVQANGCVPCPTPANIGKTSTSGMGHVRGDTNPAACGLTCPSAEGLPPFISLGIPASFAHDGWGHWITMRVDPALTADFGAGPPTTPCSPQDMATTPPPGSCTFQGGAQKGMCHGAPWNHIGTIVVQTPNNTSTPLTQQAAVIFVSHGTTGFGSFFAVPFPNFNDGLKINIDALAACTTTSGFAKCNADGDVNFVDAPISLNSADPYDDMLAYADRNTLVGYFGNSSCQTVW